MENEQNEVKYHLCELRRKNVNSTKRKVLMIHSLRKWKFGLEKAPCGDIREKQGEHTMETLSVRAVFNKIWPVHFMDWARCFRYFILGSLGQLCTQFLYNKELQAHIFNQKIDFVKILTVLTSMDFSCNNFQGGILETLRNHKSVHHLNISCNSSTGRNQSPLEILLNLNSQTFELTS